ncbi:acyclic terpene utilization AtuA family protein [Pseudonocardia sp. HH130629-09]|uniref:acyclic terpene utilization AtuA family protein n=1 Tax=Pseudonocardia sp. HH130629-09 TaxID=1641402 RepID=UPI0006CB3AB7|nr:acyclic terpene utilization AtuA family protein [Pseudonocardia sp. HH130629-09]ALE82168.1 hypothetical protein XF36_02630 [Pseudonocardia sp. HH130629-09]
MTDDVSDPVRVLVPVGMLGAGFPPGTIERGIARGADAIAIDGGSTDSGPFYLGAAQAKSARAAVRRDLRAVLGPAARAGIPVIVGSCGTSGTDAGVDWVASVVAEIIAEDGIRGRRVAKIYSEIRPAHLHARLAAGDVVPLEPAAPLTPDVLDSCAHVVGLMGHEPIAEALQADANIILAGRATDCALIAALPLLRGKPFGPTWHASKIAECGNLCTTGSVLGGVLVHIGDDGFVVEPTAEDDRATPYTVSAHMLYENVDPYRLREPAGTLVTTNATYTALDDRRVLVRGSEFEFAEDYTVKLEGSAAAGAQTVSIVGIREPAVLARLDDWLKSLMTYLNDRIPDTLGVEPGHYDIDVRPYGANAVLGDADPDPGPPREVGVVFCATAADQDTATTIAKFANPFLLHHALPGTDSVPSWSFMSSPAEMERGPLYSFVLQHVVRVDSPRELVRTEIKDH